MLTFQLFRTQTSSIFNKCVFHRNVSVSLRNINTSAPRWMSVVHKPNGLDKYLLVWMKKYPSVAEVPSTVSPSVMEKVRNQARIKITIYIMILTAFGALYMVYSGKEAAKRGESVTKMHNAWLKEQAEKK